MKETIDNRRNILIKNFKGTSIFKLAEGKPFSLEDPLFVDKLDQYFTEAIKNGLEGLIVKAIGPKTFYDTKGRTQWIKVPWYAIEWIKSFS